MSRIGGLIQRLRVVLRFSQVEDELAQELRDHFEREVERQVREGAAPNDARRRAVLRMGNIEALKEQTRDERGGRMVTDALGDLRVGWRGLRHNPGFALAVILSLSLGVAGVTAIFSVVNAVVLRPLPYPDADRLHLVRVAWNQFTASLSAADYLRLREESRGTAEVGGYWLNAEGFTLLAGQAPEVIPGANVTPETPRVLGVPPLLGRWLSEAPGAQEVLISNTLWHERFGGTPGTLGHSLMLDGTSYTVVGVMPPGYNIPGQSNGAVWVGVPIREPTRRGPFWLRVVARLGPAVTPDQASARFTGAVTPILHDRYGVEPGWRYHVVSMKDVVVGDVRPTLLMFLSAVSLVLLIASVNVANLVLARGAVRMRELSVRASLGAGRERLVRQLLAESALLGTMSGALGLAVAVILVRVVTAQAGALLPRTQEVSVDVVAAAVALGVGVLAALLSGTAPAFWLTGRRLGESLRDGGRSITAAPRQGRTRRFLVAAEVALTLSVLIGATLLVKTLIRLEREDPGFRAAGVLSFRLALPADPYGDAVRLDGFLQAVDARLREVPGVSAVAFAASLPPDQLQESNNYTLQGHEPGRPGRTSQGSGVAQWNIVTPEYFDALEIDVTRGRAFARTDHEQAPRVAMVSESFARRHFPQSEILGQRFKGGDWDADAPWTTIVGVAADVPYERGVWGGMSPSVYVPYAQNRGLRWQFVVVRAARVDDVAAAVTGAVQSVDPSVPLRDVVSMQERLRASAAVPRLRMNLFALLGVVALALAVTGIYGVLAYHVNQRRRETAIRRALGASSYLIVGDVIRSGLMLTAIGMAVGLGGGWALAHGLAGFLYGVQVNDIAAFAAAALVLGVAALLASLLPAARAVRADPLTVLREE